MFKETCAAVCRYNLSEGRFEELRSQVEGLATVNIDPARQQLIGLHSAEVKRGPVGATWRTVARISVDPTRVRKINVKVEGYVERIFVDLPRAELYVRAEARFDAMIAAGALDEVRPLLDYDPALPMMKAIGVRELAAHLRGEMALDKAIAAAKTATRHYIKRQLTWWRGQGDWAG